MEVMDFNFTTDRLSIFNYLESKINSNEDFAETTISVLSSNVTKSLPAGWQNITTISSANKWIKERVEESTFMIIQSKPYYHVIGFVFLYPIPLENHKLDIRFGYLLAENFWGKGLGTELVNGLVKKCQELRTINSISGGVELENIGSIKVLEKYGFQPTNKDTKSENVIFYEKSFSI